MSEHQQYGDLILDLLPQKPPFRFIDRITHLDDMGITAEYTFREDEYFYQGHFPGNPVTPGVIQIEAMAQTAVVAFGLYLVMKEAAPEEARQYLTVFTDVEAEFHKQLDPGTKVRITAEKLFWRRRKLRSAARLELEDGTLIAEAKLAGMGVKK